MAKHKADPLSIHYGSAQPGKGVLLTPAQKAAAGPTSAPQTVKMDVLVDRSYNGKAYKAGDTVEVPEEHVETLTLSGFGARADRVEAATQAREDADARRKAAEDLAAGTSTTVAPLSTHDVPGTEPRE